MALQLYSAALFLLMFAGCILQEFLTASAATGLRAAREHNLRPPFAPTKSGFVEESDFVIWSDYRNLPKATGAGLIDVGCYDTWENNTKLYIRTLFINDNKLEKCHHECGQEQSQDDHTFVLLKGKYCNCFSWDNFQNVRVDDSHCNVKCPGNPAEKCGGNNQFTVYCDATKDPENCDNFQRPAIVDLYSHINKGQQHSNEDDTALSTGLTNINSGHGQLLNGISSIDPTYACINCSSNNIHNCISDSISPSYDYLPENSPDACTLFCKRRIVHLRREGINSNSWQQEVREPTKYALTSWTYKQGSIEISICKCTDTIFEYFSEIEAGNCTKRCPAPSNELCGSLEPGTFTVYCTDVNGCSPGELTSTTTEHTSTTEQVTETPPIVTSEDPTTNATSTHRPGVPTTVTTTTTRTTTRPTNTTEAPRCSPKCNGQDSFGNQWTSCPDQLATKPCPNKPQDSPSKAEWYCQSSGEFRGNHPEMSKCKSEWVEKIEEKLNQTETVPPGDAKSLLFTIEDNMKVSKYYGHEIHKILNHVDIIFNKLNSTVETNTLEILTSKSLDIGSETLANNTPWLQLSLEKSTETVTKLFNVFQDNLFLTAKNLVKNSSLENSILKMPLKTEKAWIRDQFIVGTGGGVRTMLTNSSMQFPFREHSVPVDKIVLPTDWTEAVKGERVYYQGLAMSRQSVQNLLPNTQGFNANLTSLASFTAINTDLIGFSLLGSEITRANDNHTYFEGAGVTVILHHEVEAWGNKVKTLQRKLHPGEQVKVALGSAKCVYWDVIQLKWSTDGCNLIKSDRFTTVCECKHLTNFAVLFDTHSYASKQLGLEILTIILCALSIICLFTTIIIFTIVRSTHSSRTTITKNLAGCLLVGNSLVLLVMDRHYFDMSEGVCTASAILIHYAFLSAFMWMAIEGFYLYKLMIHVFDSGSNHLTMYRIMGYGIPLVIVGITGSIGFFLDEDAYGGDMFCWLQGNYIWSFLAPVAIVVIGNLIILLITLRTAYQVKTSTAQVQVQVRVTSYKTWARGCISLSVLLGLTWTIGFLITMDNYAGSVVFGYLFTILNGAQGIALFTFHCLLNEKVTAAAARRNINLPSWLSGSVSRSGEPNDSPSYLGSKTKANIKTAFQDKQFQQQSRKEQKPANIFNEQTIEALKHQHEGIPKARRRSNTNVKDVRNINPRPLSKELQETSRHPKDEQFSGTVSSIDSYHDASSSNLQFQADGNESSVSSNGSQKRLISDRRW